MLVNYINYMIGLCINLNFKILIWCWCCKNTHFVDIATYKKISLTVYCINYLYKIRKSIFEEYVIRKITFAVINFGVVSFDLSFYSRFQNTNYLG